MSRTVVIAIGAATLGIVTALVWHFLNAQVVGYLALSRFPDRWPEMLRVGVPVLIFLAIVFLSYWVFVRILGRGSIPAIWASFIAYSAITAQALFSVPAGSMELTLSILLIGAAVIPGLAALRFVSRAKKR
jgi:hypothetical protein